MRPKRLVLSLVVIIISIHIAYAGEICPPDKGIIEVKSYSSGVHILTENCENIGTFSLGGLYDGKFEKLTFSYPIPWRGTFITLKVGGKVYSNSLNPDEIDTEKNNFLDPYVTELPNASGERISMKWHLPEDIVVEQILEAIHNGTEITINATNLNDEEIYFGVRIHLDTMLGENDGAPIYIPGDGLISYEKEYYGPKLNYRYWKAYNKADNPSIIATGVLRREGITYPDRVVIANWKTSMRSAWDYDTDPFVSILGDSAVILYYGSRPIKPGETIAVSTAYINGEPVLPPSKGDFGIAEIITDRLSARYCPGDDISIKVDVLSRKTTHEGRVELKIIDEGGAVLYEEMRDTGVVNPDSVRSVEFRFKASDKISEGSLQAVSALYLSDRWVDERVTEIILDEDVCTPSQVKNDVNWVPLFLVIIISLFLVATAYLTYTYVINRGDVEVTKEFDSGLIRIAVENKTRKKLRNCVIKDEIIDGAEVNVITAGVLRRGNELTWKIGEIPSGEKVVLEYKMKKEGVLPQAVFRWDSGEKESE